MSNRFEYLRAAAETIRLRSLEITFDAGSGHPTTAMSAAEIFSVLYLDQMRFDPRNPDSHDGDDFVLSKGHGAPGMYAAMDLAGMLAHVDIRSLRRYASPLEGHPVPRLGGVRAATGSLGQGLSVGIGLAMAMNLDGVDAHSYVLLGDGEMAEGNVWEAINLAPHLGLSNLTAIVDVNRRGQTGVTMYGSDVAAYQNRLAAFGWDVQTVDGHDVEAIATALERSQDSDAPSAIIAQTVKGKGVDFLEDAEGRHGKPVSGDELDAARRQIEPRIHHVEYTPPNHVSLTPKPTLEREAVELSASYDGDQVMATRTAVGHALAELGGRDPRTVLIDGDVSNSTRTKFFFSQYPERSIQGYIAEQNMVGMAVGLQARGFYPWVVSFAAFLTRAHDQIRMGAYSRATMALSGSHTGVSIGEDGPSQMGLEDIAMMRAVPDSVVLSPCDAVSAAKLTGLLRSHRGIGYLRTIRGKTPIIYGHAFFREHGGTPIFEIGGCTVLRSSDADRFLIVATGICVHEALTAAEELDRQGIPAGVIDAYCLKPLPEAVLRTAASKVPHVVTVEDHYAQGGLSEAVAAALSGISRVHRLAVSGIPHSGDAASLMAEYQIDAAGIQAVCKRILSADT